MLVANKCDLRDDQTASVKFDDGQRLARVSNTDVRASVRRRYS